MSGLNIYLVILEPPAAGHRKGALEELLALPVFELHWEIIPARVYAVATPMVMPSEVGLSLTPGPGTSAAPTWVSVVVRMDDAHGYWDSSFWEWIATHEQGELHLQYHPTAAADDGGEPERDDA